MARQIEPAVISARGICSLAARASGLTCLVLRGDRERIPLNEWHHACRIRPGRQRPTRPSSVAARQANSGIITLHREAGASPPHAGHRGHAAPRWTIRRSAPSPRARSHGRTGRRRRAARPRAQNRQARGIPIIPARNRRSRFTEHAVLAVALLRSLGVLARAVGMVYSEASRARATFVPHVGQPTGGGCWSTQRARETSQPLRGLRLSSSQNGDAPLLPQGGRRHKGPHRGARAVNEKAIIIPSA